MEGESNGHIPHAEEGVSLESAIVLPKLLFYKYLLSLSDLLLALTWPVLAVGCWPDLLHFWSSLILSLQSLMRWFYDH